MAKEMCKRCGEKDYDRRTLKMACFYDMMEIGVPFTMSEDKNFYCLLVCKDCRADWMNAIKEWFYKKPVRESCGSGIFVRRNGATVEITEEEWAEENPDRDPVRVRP